MGELDSGTEAALLAKRAIAGDGDAYTELVKLYYGRVYAVALARVRVPEVAEELAQDVFVRAYLHATTLRDPALLPAWLMSITRNLAVTWIVQARRKSRILPLIALGPGHTEIPATGQPSARDECVDRNMREHLNEAIAELPEDMREIVLLHYAEEVSRIEIARLLNVHASTVTRRLEQAVAMLRTRLGVEAKPEAVRPLRPRKAAAATACALVAALAGMSKPARAELIALAASDGVAPAPESGVIAITPGAGKIMLSILGIGTLLIAAGLTYFTSQQPAAPPTSNRPSRTRAARTQRQPRRAIAARTTPQDYTTSGKVFVSRWEPVGSSGTPSTYVFRIEAMVYGTSETGAKRRTSPARQVTSSSLAIPRPRQSTSQTVDRQYVASAADTNDPNMAARAARIKAHQGRIETIIEAHRTGQQQPISAVPATTVSAEARAAVLPHPASYRLSYIAVDAVDTIESVYSFLGVPPVKAQQLVAIDREIMAGILAHSHDNQFRNLVTPLIEKRRAMMGAELENQFDKLMRPPDDGILFPACDPMDFDRHVAPALMMAGVPQSNVMEQRAMNDRLLQLRNNPTRDNFLVGTMERNKIYWRQKELMTAEQRTSAAELLLAKQDAQTTSSIRR